MDRKRMVTAIITIILLLTLLPTHKASATDITAVLYNNKEYPYYTVLDIYNPNNYTLTDFQVNITLNSSWPGWEYAPPNISPRFYLPNGTEIPYWVQEWDTTAKKGVIWLKLNLTAQNYTEVVMLWGNSQAKSLSNANKVFLLFDNFNESTLNTSKWENVSTPTAYAKVTNGVLQLHPDGTHRGYVMSVENFTGNLEIIAEGYTSAANGVLGCLLYWDGTHTASYDRPTKAIWAWYGLYTDIKLLNGTTALNETSSAPSMSAYTNYIIDLKYVNGNVSFSVKGSLINEELKASNVPLTGAWHVGLVSREQAADSYFRWVLVKKAAPKEPTVTFTVQSASNPFSVKGYLVSVDGKSFKILGEGQGNLSSIIVKFLNSNFTPVSTKYLTPNNTQVTGPSSGVAILELVSGSVIRLYYLNGLNSSVLSFPSVASTVIPTKVFVEVPGAKYLEIKTLTGDISERVSVGSGYASFMGVENSEYRFEAYSSTGKLLYSTIIPISATTQDILVMPTSNPLNVVLPLQISVSAALENGTIVGNVTLSKSESGSISVSLYSSNWTLLEQASLGSFSGAKWNFLYSPPSNVSWAVAIVKASANGVVGEAEVPNGSAPSIPSQLFPNGLKILLIGALGLFTAVRLNIGTAGLILSTLLALSKLMGWISIPTPYIAVIYGLSASLFLFGRSYD